MRHSWRVVVLVLLVIPLTATAQSGGFVGPDGRELPVTVVEVASLAEEALVRLVGCIMKSLGDERYEFSDETGTIVVEIDDDGWNGLEATPNDRVEIAGEIHREGDRLEGGNRVSTFREPLAHPTYGEHQTAVTVAKGAPGTEVLLVMADDET